MINLESITAVLSVLLILSGSVERLIEIVKPLIAKIPNPEWETSAKVVFACLVGTFLAALFQYDLFVQLGLSLGISPWLGYLGSGLFISSGSSVIHPLLEWLKTLSNPNPPVEPLG